MATTGMWSVKSRLDHLVSYVSNPLKTVTQYVINDDKTMEKQYVSYINCSFENPKESMENTKKHYHDESKILAFHGFQSFEEDEVDADLAHQIGVEFTKKMWGSRFEVIISTHLDTDNIHNHFLLNSTSFVDGKRYCNTYNDIQKMRDVSDELCKEYGLSVIENKQYVGKSRASYFLDKTLRSIIREDIDEAVKVSYTMQQLYNELELLGYEIKETNKNIAVKHPMSKKFIRLKSLGNEYINERMIDRVLDLSKEQKLYFPMYDHKGFNIKPYFEKYKTNQLTGLQRLYLHYQYVLKIIPKDNRSRVNHEDRKEYNEAVKQLESISQQTIILCKNNIVTVDELQEYMDNLEKQINQLLKERQCYRNQARCYRDDNKQQECKDKAKAHTPILGKLRKELSYCKEIETRSFLITKFIDEKEDAKSRRLRENERN